jgi:hypothetical protein
VCTGAPSCTVATCVASTTRARPRAQATRIRVSARDLARTSQAQHTAHSKELHRLWCGASKCSCSPRRCPQPRSGAPARHPTVLSAHCSWRHSCAWRQFASGTHCCYIRFMLYALQHWSCVCVLQSVKPRWKALKDLSVTNPASAHTCLRSCMCSRLERPMTSWSAFDSQLLMVCTVGIRRQRTTRGVLQLLLVVFEEPWASIPPAQVLADLMTHS